MKNALSTRLQQARGRLFVGRAAYLESFALALRADSWPFAVWHLHGLGGMGKTSLLRQWKEQAQEAGVTVMTLDGRNFDPTPAAFCQALRQAILELPPELRGEASGEAPAVSGDNSATLETLCAALEALKSRVVLQIDTYELLAPLDHFLRESFLPHLPENTTVMLAGREKLSFEWHSDAAWHELVREFNLDGLSPDEGRLYLEKRAIAPTSQNRLLKWAHGHPLALSLAADVWLQHPDSQDLADQTFPNPAVIDATRASAEFLKEEAGEKSSRATDFSPDDLPHLVGPLLGHLVREVPTPAHRAALEASAIVLSITQELLGDMLGDLVHSKAPEAPVDAAADGAANEKEGVSSDIRTLFEWLRGLSIMQSQRFGVFPHDLARELLVADLRWRSPDWHAELHRRAREHYLRRIHRAGEAEQQRAIFNCIYLHRLSPVVGPYLRWNDASCSIDGARPEDMPALLDMVEKHEGQASRDLAAQHFEAQPDGLVVVRNQGGDAQGFVFQLALRGVSDALYEADPATRAARDFLCRNAPSRTGSTSKTAGSPRTNGDQATLFRFWMDKEIYQNVGATQSLIFVQAVRHYMTTPHLSFTFFPCADPEFWSDGFAYADLQRLPGADFEVGGHKYGVFGHDWRARPVLSWLDLLSQREMQTVEQAPQTTPLLAPGTDFVVLDEEEFYDAVHLALRSRDAAALRRSPLLQTALVTRRAQQMAASFGSASRSGGAAVMPSLDERVMALRDLIKEAIADVESAPRQEKSHRALELVFGRRALSQEAAAAAMHVSHSSLRRYLRAGVIQVAAALHERENRREASNAPSGQPASRPDDV